jgi:L-ascorbate metabolism protein UlaG (beta-lactamase superfamily)
VTLPHARVTYIGGPTALVEIGGLRLLTDPTFDPAGSEYPTAVYTLRKTQGPALGADDIGEVDAVLLSHDHHFDNLDVSGRAELERAFGEAGLASRLRWLPRGEGRELGRGGHD